jgi:hypothetical protein
MCVGIFPIVGDSEKASVVKKIQDRWPAIKQDVLTIILGEINNIASQIKDIKKEKEDGVISASQFNEKRENLQNAFRLLVNTPEAENGLGIHIPELDN